MKINRDWLIDKWTEERSKRSANDQMFYYINEFIIDIRHLNEREVKQIQELYSYNDELIEENNELRKTLDKQEILSKELLVVPKFIADFIEARKNVFINTLQYVFHRAMENRVSELFEEEYEWVRHNSETFARAWLDGYTVANEPLYHALIKGHDVSGDYDVYWNCDKSDRSVFVSGLHPLHDNFLTEMSKSEWNKLGINDSNAYFVKVEEV